MSQLCALVCITEQNAWQNTHHQVYSQSAHLEVDVSGVAVDFVDDVGDLHVGRIVPGPPHGGLHRQRQLQTSSDHRVKLLVTTCGGSSGSQVYINIVLNEAERKKKKSFILYNVQYTINKQSITLIDTKPFPSAIVPVESIKRVFVWLVLLLVYVVPKDAENINCLNF